jgi:hypothetical protein
MKVVSGRWSVNSEIVSGRYCIIKRGWFNGREVAKWRQCYVNVLSGHPGPANAGRI